MEEEKGKGTWSFPQRRRRRRRRKKLWIQLLPRCVSSKCPTGRHDETNFDFTWFFSLDETKGREGEETWFFPQHEEKKGKKKRKKLWIQLLTCFFLLLLLFLRNDRRVGEEEEEEGRRLGKSWDQIFRGIDDFLNYLYYYLVSFDRLG